MRWKNINSRFPIQSLLKDMNEGNSWNLEIWEVPIKSRETFDVDSPPLFTIQCTKGTDLENLQRNKEVASYLKRRLAVRKSALLDMLDVRKHKFGLMEKNMPHLLD